MCVFKYHAFIYFLQPPPWYGTGRPSRSGLGTILSKRFRNQRWLSSIWKDFLYFFTDSVFSINICFFFNYVHIQQHVENQNRPRIAVSTRAGPRWLLPPNTSSKESWQRVWAQQISVFYPLYLLKTYQKLRWNIYIT
jgi:hypothetical protein